MNKIHFGGKDLKPEWKELFRSKMSEIIRLTAKFHPEAGLDINKVIADLCDRDELPVEFVSYDPSIDWLYIQEDLKEVIRTVKSHRKLQEA